MRPPAPIPILAYHQTAASPPRGSPLRDLVLPPRRFEQQMRALHRRGWRGLSLADLGPHLRGEGRGKVLGITLDDGYASTFEHALPVLAALGFTATSFVVSDRVGGRNDWDARLGAAPAALMDLPQLRAWVAAGMEVGAHTCSHVDLSAVDADTAREEISRCRLDLEQALGVAVRSFSYPYGRLRDEHVAMARAAGYALAVTCASQRVPAQADPLQLPRITVWASTPLPLLLARVASSLEDRRAWLRAWRARHGFTTSAQDRLDAGASGAPAGAAPAPAAVISAMARFLKRRSAAS